MFPIAVVRGLVRHFADLARYEGAPIYVTQNLETFDAIRRRKRYSGRVDEDHEYGATLVGSPPVVWVNAQEKSTRLVVRTCAHEALHVARPSMRHGQAFDRAVGRLLRGTKP
jgi:hypothetical protein